MDNLDASDGLSVIVPASNEAAVIGGLLDSLLDSVLTPLPVEIIVVANGCRDDTVAVAQRFADRAEARDWSFSVIDVAQGGKLNALNVGDDHAAHANRIYLDADVIVSPGLIEAVADALDRPDPVYACGALVVARPSSLVTRRYARFWTQLPFVADGAPGCGMFAVNAAGRALWGRFPDIISDDTFVRLHFSPERRVEVPEAYVWPMVEGFRNLVRVRRRQDRGVKEVARLYPALLANEKKSALGAGRLARLAMRDPVGFLVYAAVSLAVRIPVGAGRPRTADPVGSGAAKKIGRAFGAIGVLIDI